MDRFTRDTMVLKMLTAAAAVLPIVLAVLPVSADLYYYKDAEGVFYFSERKGPGAERFDPAARRARVARPEKAGIRRAGVARAAAAPRPAPPRAPATAGTATRYDRLIHTTARRYGVEPELVKAMVRAESNFNRLAVSHRGARGLMQLMPRTAHSYGVRNLHDPEQNIQGGVRHLRGLLDRFRSVRLAVAAYNAGASTVRRHRGIPPYRETRRYVEKVLRFRAEYQREAGVALIGSGFDLG